MSTARGPQGPYKYRTFVAPDMDEAWKEKALCRTIDGDWVSWDRTVGATVVYREAKKKELAVCAACSVSADCLDYAMTIGEKHGIWGGLLPGERRKLRRNK